MCATTPPVLTYRELRAAGRTRRWIERAVHVGVLVRVRRGTYVHAAACDPARTAASHGGAMGCVTAARHLGMWVLDDDPSVHVWLGGRGHAYHPAACGCVEHWDDGELQNTLTPAAVPRVLRQILRCRGVVEFFVALESALRQRLIAAAGLRWLRAHTNDTAREAIDFAREDADSGLESLFRWRLRAVELDLRCQVFIVGVGRVDFLIGDRLIVEIDGKGNHAGHVERHRDLMRDASAAVWDYTTLRFDYAMVVHDWETVEAAILAQLAASHHLRP